MRFAAFTLLVLTGVSCDNSKTTGTTPSAAPVVTTTGAVVSAAPSASPTGPAPDGPPGDVAQGKELVAKFECNRCHDGTGLEAAALPKHCVHCHQQIIAGTFKGAPAAKLTQWQAKMSSLREVPSLTAVGKRYRRGWIERYLQNPHDLRPRLLASMPRLAISPEQARHVASYLVSLDKETEAPTLALDGADTAKGRELLDAKGCGSCHAFGGVPPLAGGTPPKLGEKELRTAVALAPDLRFARDRFGAGQLARWLADPKAVKADTAMPMTPLTAEEIKHIVAYLMNAPLAAVEAKALPQRLPVLDRKVTYDEVYERVLRDTCRHCHAEPDYDPAGDGGPGNTGGFGFKPRKLDLARYEGVAAGWVDDAGERQSVFKAMPDGTPRLVAAMIARQAEEAGKPNPEIRGMPLGLPAFSAEDVQHVETWIAQGRPR